MGLDLYAGPLTRYVAGAWATVVQQAGAAGGVPVEVMRPGPADDAVTDLAAVHEVVTGWRDRLVNSLNAGDGWVEQPDGDYHTDKPDWDGYGAVVLLAAYDEQPRLAPGAVIRRGLRRTETSDVDPRMFSDSPAVNAAREDPQRYPTLLLAAQWCLPLSSGPTIFSVPTPNGTVLRMGRIDQLQSELHELNERILRLTGGQLSELRRAGPPNRGTPARDVAPFGLSVLLSVVDYAAANRLPWIMDY
jgi:hypothetical protein